MSGFNILMLLVMVIVLFGDRTSSDAPPVRSKKTAAYSEICCGNLAGITGIRG
jgi:hypothetical protein